MSNENQAKPVAAALPASNDHAKQADTELRGMLMRAIEWANEFGNGNIATAVISGALVSTGRRLAATPALPAEKVQGLTDDEETALLCQIEDYLSITDVLSQAHPDSAKVEAKIYAMVNGFIASRFAASGGVPAPALPVVPEGSHLNVWNDALEEAALICDSVNNHDNPMTAGDCADAIRALKSVSAAPELPEGNQQPQTMADRDSALHAEPAGQRCISPLATRPILYTDTVNGVQTCRDDLWAVTTEELNELATRCRAEGGVTSDKASFAPSHAASTEPVGVVVVFNEGGSGEYRAVAPIGKPNYNLANFLPEGTKLFTHAATQAAQLTEQDAEYAERYRWLREQRGIKGDFPMDGDCWVVQLSQPKGAMPGLRCAGFGDKLDTTIDAAIFANQSQKG